ncbi:MAG TPA: glycine oxidase ThiO [Pyrinomonadaceae bacterium]|nr:glycine oxidase ThiO [Pyrinomonadaceae bacterium]
MSRVETYQGHATAEVVIIGGGVIGLTVARALALRGVRDVLLIDRSSLGTESSYAAGGILAPQAEADRADEFFELACQSRDLYPTFAAALLDETGTDIELDTTGTLYLALSEKDEEEIEQRYEWQQRAGLTLEKLSAEEAQKLEPRIAATVRGALLFPLDIQVENRRLLTALIAANEKLGVSLISGTNVESMRLQNGRVAGVETARGFVSTRRVVVASGAWASLLSSSEGSDSRMPRVRIEPVRGQMLCFAAQPPLVRHVIYSPRGYLVPRHDGRLLAGSTTEHAGYARQVTASGMHAILSNALDLAPALGSLPLIDSWSGLRPRAQDDWPVLGPSEIEGLFYATGHYRNGILLAPITGELIAEAIASRVISSLLSRFSPHRFDLAHVF